MKLGLRIKFFLYSNTLIVVTMTLVTVLAMVHERQHALRRDRPPRPQHRRGAGHPDRRRPGGPRRADPAPRPGLIEFQIAEILERNRDLMRYVVVDRRRGPGASTPAMPDLLGRPFDAAARSRRSPRRRSSSPRSWKPARPRRRILEVRAPLRACTGAAARHRWPSASPLEPDRAPGAG